MNLKCVAPVLGSQITGHGQFFGYLERRPQPWMRAVLWSLLREFAESGIRTSLAIGVRDRTAPTVVPNYLVGVGDKSAKAGETNLFQQAAGMSARSP